MADLKISELSALAGGDLVAADELAIVDDSASETKKITVSNLIANGVTLISDDSIPGAKILFGAGDIATAALADSAVTALKIANDAVTAAKIADNVIVDLVSELPASGDYTGQLALDTDDNSLYVWSGTAWLNTKAPASVNAFTDTSAGIINITTSVSGGTATVTASIDDTTAAAQFLAGPVGSAGTVGYRAIDGGDLPTATTTAKGGVVVNGNGLVMDGSTIEIDNSVTASSVSHLVTYDAKGLITGGRVIASSDLPVATTSAKGAVLIGSTGGLTVNASGNVSINNDVTSGTYTKVTVTAKGVVSAGDTLDADDIPDHSAAKLTSGTIGSSLIANGAITASKMADQSTVKFGGALGSDNVTIFPAGDFKGQLFWDETSEDLYIYSGSAFIPITVLSGNLVNAGAYDASTNTMSSVTTAGSSAGFSAGAALPAPAAGNLNHYVVVDTSGTGSGAAPAVALAPPDMLLSQGVGTEYALIDVSNAIAGQTASNISVIASGNIAATDVQAALQEVDSEKLQKSGDTMTGALGIGTASSIVFEGSTADDYETTLTVTDPTADRTITLPNVTGTVVTTGDTGSVTSTMIANGTIANADISSSAEIAVSKLANGTARQLLQTDSGGTGVEFTSNVDVPGTLDVTNAATFDSTVTATGLITANGKVSFPAGTAAAPSLYPGSDTDTGIYSPGSDQLALATNGTGRLFIDSSGRLGIGTTSPDSLFDLEFANSRMRFEQETGSNRPVIRGTRTSDKANRGISFGGSDISFLIGSTSTTALTSADEKARIDSSGRLLVGTSTNTDNYLFQVDSDNGNVAQLTRYGADGATLVIGSSRGTQGAKTTLNNNDYGGLVAFKGYDGSNFQTLAWVGAQCDGQAPASGDSPGRLVFSSTPSGSASPVERVRITNSGYHKVADNGSYWEATGSYHEINSSVDNVTAIIHNSNASFSKQGNSGGVTYTVAARAATSAYSLAVFLSNSGADTEFNLRGDGNAFADGSWTGGGADYAEYFEWSDSNPDAEDRRGISVVLDGDKIREAVTGEDPIGVISGNPSVVGDAAWNKWSGKYLRDEFGTYIQEDYEVTDDDGNTVIQQRRKLNPAYDPDVEYISREERPEWDCVGLMGKLRVRKGQVTGSRWIKMRDISDSVEEWLVR